MACQALVGAKKSTVAPAADEDDDAATGYDAVAPAELPKCALLLKFGAVETCCCW